MTSKKVLTPEKEVQQDYIDLTKTGPLSYRQLQSLNNNLPDLSDDSAKVENYNPASQSFGNIGQIEYIEPDPNNTFGESRYDENFANPNQFENYQDYRAQNQPWINKVLAGVAKGAVLTGTTLINGTIGLLWGLGQGIANLADNDKNTGFFSGFWDNDLIKATQSMANGSEDIFPNYYTQDEIDNPMGHIFSANFIGDKLIKNLGFSIGAMYSGNVISGALEGLGLATGIGKMFAGSTLKAAQAYRAERTAENLAKYINASTKLANAPKAISSVVGATVSTINEAGIEAVTNSKQWKDGEINKLDGLTEQRLNQAKAEFEANKGTFVGNIETGYIDPAQVKYDNEVAKIKSDYQEALKKIEEDRVKMGNADFLTNIPLLMAGNLIQFGKLYGNGYRTGRKAVNIIKRASGEYAAKEASTGRRVARAILNPLTEGNEEMAQNILSTIPQNYYSQDVDNFYKAKVDPNAEQQTIDLIKTIGGGIAQNLGDANSWEQFLIGSMTGALGVPTFGKRANSGNSTYIGKGKSVGLSGGIFGEWADSKEDIERQQEVTNYLNERVKSPKFKAYYQGLIRHNKYQNDMDNALEEGDKFNYKNAEHAQLVSDIAMFDNADKLEDLNVLINSAFDTSDENLESIVKNTTKEIENQDGSISKSGPFLLDEKGNPKYSTPEGKKEMIDEITKSKEDIFNTLQDYLKTKNNIDIYTGQALNDDQLEELTWMKTQINNWDQRAEQMSGEIKSYIGKIIGTYSKLGDQLEELKNLEGKRGRGDLSEAYLQLDEVVRNNKTNLNVLSDLKNKDDKTLATILKNSPKLIDNLVEQLDKIDNDVLDVTQKDNITNNLLDIKKLGEASKIYNAKYEEYLRNPAGQRENQAKVKDEVAKDITNAKNSDFKNKLLNAKNLTEFKNILNEEQDDNIKKNVLSELKTEGNQLAKNHEDINKYNAEIQRAIDEMQDEDDDTKNDAKELFRPQFERAEKLEQIANPTSIYMQNQNAFDESSGGDPELSSNRFIAAQYVAQKAISKVNNDNQFKDRFTPEFKVPVGEKSIITKTITKNQTGFDETSTIPTVNGEDTKVKSTGEPIEVVINNEGIEIKYNETHPQIKAENLETIINTNITHNDELSDDQSNLDINKNQNRQGRQFYRPAIPEYNIQGMKSGEFVKLGDVEENQKFENAYAAMLGKKAKLVDFSAIYNYLESNGAFKFVNEGNLKVGDEIGFMIDPSFNNTTIFMIHKKTGQIVGSLDESEYSVNKFEGLKELETKIYKEFRDSGNTKERFIATLTVNVSRIMNGRVPLSKEERNLKDIDGVGTRPLFAISKNGVMFTNNQIPLDKVIKPNDMSKNGRLYLLILNASGKYTPMMVKVKHFNRAEFNMEDINIANTPIGKNIKHAIEALAQSKTQGDIAIAMKELATYIHLQDVMVTFFNGKKGNGIVISIKQRDENGNYKKEVINGKERIVETKKAIYFNSGEDDTNVVADFSDPGVTPTYIPVAQEKREEQILNTLQSFNLPIQVNARMLNEDNGYTELLLDSNILSSNISQAQVKSSWFITDYYDKNGVHQNGVPPVKPVPVANIDGKDTNPVGGTNTVVPGVLIKDIRNNNKSYYIDLKDSINPIKDENGNPIAKSKINEHLIDLAWAQETYGDATEGWEMINNQVLLPSGRVLDRTNQKYLTEKEAAPIKEQIAKKGKKPPTTEEVLGKINDNQAKVDKTKTDSEYYYVLEEDGQYHKYERVHKRIGSNSKDNKRKNETLKNIKFKLMDTSGDVQAFNKYLGTLSAYNVDLTAYMGKTDAISRQEILNSIEQSLTDYNSSKELSNGSQVDKIIRQFFTQRDVSKIEKPDNLSTEAFDKLIQSLINIRVAIEKNGERFYADNVVVFHKYADGTRIAGELDILSVDKKGNFKIYDVKTSKNSFYNFEKNGKSVNYFTNVANFQNMSTKDYYTLQLSAYKNLFESEFGVPVQSLAIMPFVLTYNGDQIIDINNEKGIPLTYNPNVNVPLGDKTAATTTVTIPQTSTNNTTQSAASALGALLNEDEEDDDADIIGILRVIDNTIEYKQWDQKKELKWMDKVLPQLSANDRIQVVKGLINVANKGPFAWGQFNEGMVTLSDVAAEGTVYHEAFHVVFNQLLNEEERQTLFAEARDKYGNKSDLELEEAMAEEFREYTMTRDKAGIGTKILNFFKELFAKVTNWKYMQPHLTAYYQAINQGKYANKIEVIPSITDSRIKNNIKYRMFSDTSIKPGVSELFESNPELRSIGTEEQYSQYLDTIFPNSLIKVIVYHWARTPFDAYNKEERVALSSDLGEFLNVSIDKNVWREYASQPFMNKKGEYQRVNPTLQYYIINLTNPYLTDDYYLDKLNYNEQENIIEQFEDIIEKTYDGIIEGGGNQIAIFDNKNILKLGSKQDIQGFKGFVQSKQFQKLTTEEKAKTIEQVTKEHRSITALKDLSHKLAYRIGGKIEFVNKTDVDWKGYNQGMTSVLNEAYMTPDTPFHEILAHPIIRAIKTRTNYYKTGETAEFHGYGEPYRVTIEKIYENTLEADIIDEKGSKQKVDLFELSKTQNTLLYQSLLKELETGRGKEVFEQVKRDYKHKENKTYTIYESEDWGQTYYDIVKIGEKLPDLSKEREGLTFKNKDEALKRIEELNPKVKYTLKEQQEEAIVTLLGLMAADKLDAKKDATLISKLKELWKQISDFVKSLLRQDEIRIDELPITTTLNDLAEIMAYGNNKIILPGYKVEYSTPLGNKYDTLEEVNQEIKMLSSLGTGEKIDNITPEWLNKKLRRLEEVENRYKEEGIMKNSPLYNELEKEIAPIRFIKDFIEKNKEYEQSKEIIEQWKKENNIQYDPEEVYSRGQGFYSSIGAYSNLELDLLLQNLIQHIQDNKKAGGEFTISAFTKPINTRLKHIEGTGDRVRFVIYPQSEHIKWAAPTDVYSGSVWDAHAKVSKDKKSELLGVSFTKAPALRNIHEISPNLADIIDNLSYVHNELGIELTIDNFRIEYDDNIDYSTKKLIDNINKILDDKYGKLVKPEIKKQGEKIVQYGLYSKGANDILDWFDTEEEAQAKVDGSNKQLIDLGESPDYSVRPVTKAIGKQPTQTRENTTSIGSVKDKLYNENYDNQLKNYESAQQGIIPEYYSTYTNLNGKLSRKIHVFVLNSEKTKNEVGMWQKDEDYDIVKDFIVGEDENQHGVKFWILSNQFKKEALNSYKEPIKGISQEKEYTSQAEINFKIAALKEVARKYPRSLVTSKVVPINPNMVDNSEIQYSKVGSKQDVEGFKKFIKNNKFEQSSFNSLSKNIQESLLKKGWTTNWASLTNEQTETLSNRGWNQEEFERISEEEREKIIQCYAF